MNKQRLIPIILTGLLLGGCLGSKISLNNYDKVTDMMDEQDVIKILGEPTRNIDGVLLGKTLEWKNDNLQITIQFVDGKVYEKHYSPL